MTALLAFHFIRPAWLLLLPAGILAWTLRRRQSDPLRGWRRQIDPVLLAALTPGRNRHLTPGAAPLILWITGVLAAAGPTWRTEPNPFADDATPLMIVLKADASMETPDPEPSRIERAHMRIADIAGERSGQPLGLIAYAGSAHLVLPPTRDTGIVATMAAEIAPGIMPVPGDRPDLALATAHDALRGDGTILLIADTAPPDFSPPSLAGDGRLPPVQVLALNRRGSPEDTALRTAAKALGAQVEAFAPDGSDLAPILRRAARRPVPRKGDADARWQEAGYYLTPVFAILALAPFRRVLNPTPSQ